MGVIEYKKHVFEVNDDGFLKDFEQWNKVWVEYITTKDGITELTKDHWLIINTIQDYYIRNGIPPMVRILRKMTNFTYKKIYNLFPSGPRLGACKAAGLPRPEGCI